MYLIVKHKDQPEKELRFRDGPIYIGRQLGSQVFLPDKLVSRQHAVIYSTKDGQWILEDLDSANKTYLNSRAIHKAQIKDGDIFQISDFTIEVKFVATTSEPKPINMDDTLLNVMQEIRLVSRKFDELNGQAFRLSSAGIKNYAEAVCAICKAKTKKELLDILVDTFQKQLLVSHIWIGFKTPDEPSFHTYFGKTPSGVSVELDSLILKTHIVNSVEKMEFKLIPRLHVEDKEKDKMRSALIAPILFEKKCFGIIYIDNSLQHEQYDIMDLNYLMLLSVNIGTILQKI
jgi:pSer/pThr/pTyr-binding forkhead associated (FHA) protein